MNNKTGSGKASVSAKRVRARVKPSKSDAAWRWGSRFMILAIVIGTGVISGLVSYRLLSYGREVAVPAVIDLRLADAVATLRQAGLRYEIVSQRHDEQVSAAHVLEQRVQAGQVVKEKSRIGIVLSLGSAYRQTPDFLGRSLEESRLVAQRDDLSIVRVTRTRHDDVEAGRVIAQNPEPGTSGRPDVSLLVSMGPTEKKIQVPNLIGQPAAAAQALLADRGLRYQAEGKGGVIMWQRPEPGISVTKGTEISVGFGLGPEDTQRYPWEGEGGGWKR